MYGRSQMALLLALAVAPVSSSNAARPPLTVDPAVGGRDSTVSVRLSVARTRYYKISLRSPCGSSAPYPWTQTLQLPGRDFASGRDTLRFARPEGGWCSGRFRGTVWRNDFTDLTKIGRFAFTIKPHVHTKLPEAPCRPRGSKTVMESAQARVFSVRSGRLTYYDGCLFRSRMHIQLAAGVGFTLGGGFDPQYIDAVRLTGDYVSSLVSFPGPADAEQHLIVRDLRTGEQVAAFPGVVRVDGEVLTETGTVAWLGSNWDDYPAISVRTLDAHGTTVLDSGPDIDRSSLRLDGSTLTWTNGGVEKSAAL